MTSTTNFAALPPAARHGEPDATAASWYGLAALILITLFSVADRQVFVLQAEVIRVQLALTDFQLGLLQGVGVSLSVAIATYPIGWLADRYDRRWVLAACIVLWSLGVAACGLAHDYTSLFVASAMVGLGEAGLAPIVLALIPEMFRNDKRQLANSLSVVVGRLGMGMVIAFCGFLTVLAESARPYLPAALQAMESWRLTFFAAALPAPLFVLMLLTLPVRANAAGSRASAVGCGGVSPTAPLAGALDFIRSNLPGVGGFFASVTLVTFGAAAVGAWLPIVAMRQFGATPLQLGNALGSATLVSTLIGLLVSVYGMRWLRARVGVQLPVVTLALGCAACALSALALLLPSNIDALFVVFGVHLTALMLVGMTFPTALQNLAPPHLRSRMFALLGTLAMLCASAAPPLVGLLSDQIRHRSDGLLLVTATLGGAAFLLAALGFARTAKHYGAALRAVAEAS
jgi:MFS family permease